MVNEDVEDFNEFHFSLLFFTHAFYSHGIFPIVCKKVNWQNCFKFLVLSGGHLLI